MINQNQLQSIVNKGYRNVILEKLDIVPKVRVESARLKSNRQEYYMDQQQGTPEKQKKSSQSPGNSGKKQNSPLSKYSEYLQSQEFIKKSSERIIKKSDHLINKKYDGLNKSKDKSDQHTSTYSKDSVKKDVSKGNLKSTDRDKNLIKYTQENIKKSQEINQRGNENLKQINNNRKNENKQSHEIRKSLENVSIKKESNLKYSPNKQSATNIDSVKQPIKKHLRPGSYSGLPIDQKNNINIKIKQKYRPSSVKAIIQDKIQNLQINNNNNNIQMLNPLRINIPRQIKSAKQRLESINKLQPLYDIDNKISPNLRISSANEKVINPKQVGQLKSLAPLKSLKTLSKPNPVVDILSNYNNLYSKNKICNIDKNLQKKIKNQL